MIPWLRHAAYLAVTPVLRTAAFFHILSRADVFSPPLFRVALCVAGTALVAPGTAGAETCQGQIGARTVVDGKTAYDPFSPANVADNHHVTITNTGSKACAYALVFRARNTDPRLGGTLDYSIASEGSRSLLTTASPPFAPAARTKSPVAPGASAPIEFQILIERGQSAAPGVYTDEARLELYALDESGHLGAAPLQTAVLHIDYDVARVLSVNIKGADASQTTMRFGKLATGAVRTVEIQARSNLSYQLDVASDHGGALVLTPGVPGQNWSIPYTATLGGHALDLAAGASVRDQQPTRPEADASFPLTVTIGDTTQKRAGRYEDVLTVEIKGAAP